jgi:hypothetical protein
LGRRLRRPRRCLDRESGAFSSSRGLGPALASHGFLVTIAARLRWLCAPEVSEARRVGRLVERAQAAPRTLTTTVVTRDARRVRRPSVDLRGVMTASVAEGPRRSGGLLLAALSVGWLSSSACQGPGGWDAAMSRARRVRLASRRPLLRPATGGPWGIRRSPCAPVSSPDPSSARSWSVGARGRRAAPPAAGGRARSRGAPRRMRHADPRTTMRHDIARASLDGHAAQASPPALPA